MFTGLLLIIYLSFVSLGFSSSLLGAAWPAMQSSLHLPASGAGLISAFLSGATVLSSFYSDRLVRRWGTPAIAGFSILFISASLLAYSLTGSMLSFCLLALPLGLGAGALDAGLNNYVALHYQAQHMNWLHSFWGVGAAVGPVIMSLALREFNSWQVGYRIVAALQFLTVVLIYVSRGKWDKHLEQSAETHARKQNVLSIKQRLSLPKAWAALSACFAYCAIEASMGLWGSSFLVRICAFTAVQAAQYVAMYMAGITLGRFFSGFLSMRLSTKSIMRIALILLLASVLVMQLSSHQWAQTFVFFGMGLGSAPVFPAILHETPKNFGTANSQSMIGTQMAASFVGMTIMPPLFGFLADFIGYGVFPIFLAGLVLLLGFSIWSLHRPTEAVDFEHLHS